MPSGSGIRCYPSSLPISYCLLNVFSEHDFGALRHCVASHIRVGEAVGPDAEAGGRVSTFHQGVLHQVQGVTCSVLLESWRSSTLQPSVMQHRLNYLGHATLFTAVC